MLDKTSIYAVVRDVKTEVPQAEVHSQPRWTIVAEAHPMLGVGKSEVMEYCAVWDDKVKHHHVHALELGSHDSIIGSILIAESAHVSQKKLNTTLEEQHEAKGGSLDAESTSEDWLKHALHLLQRQEALEEFDVTAFMTFAHGYLADRLSDGSEAPATIAYPQLHPEHEKKAKKHGFWISHPETADNKSGQKIYGGLM